MAGTPKKDTIVAIARDEVSPDGQRETVERVNSASTLVGNGGRAVPVGTNGVAGDQVFEEKGYGLTPTDIIEQLPTVLKDTL